LNATFSFACATALMTAAFAPAAAAADNASAAEPPLDSARDKPITVVFRYDDYAGDVIDNVDMRLIDIFRARRLQLTMAIIPSAAYTPLSAEKARIMRAAMDGGVVDAAQHGYTHDVLAPIKGQSFYYGSEFKGVHRIEQKHRIAEGRAFLEKSLGRRSRPLSGFVPPYNSYDLTTLSVLEELGFECLSSSLGGPVEGATRLKLVPAMGELPGVRAAVELARTRAPGRPVLIVPLFHNYDFREHAAKPGPMTLDDFEKLLDWLAEQKDVRVLSIGQVCATTEDLGVERYVANQALFDLAPRVPACLQSRFPAGVYFTTDLAAGVRRQWLFILAAIYLGIALVAGVVTWGVATLTLKRLGGLRQLCLAGATALALGAVAYGWPNRYSTSRALIVVSVLVGVCAGVWLTWWRQRHVREA
jgi:peptidoglycan/xylan/chitin deacetylase (PgdA/CDA1 family)